MRYRAILDRRALAEPGLPAALESSVAEGEEIRLAESVPIKMMIAGRDHATVPLDGDEPGAAASILVHAGGVLDALIAMLEYAWEKAQPVGRGDGGAGLVEQTPDELDPLDRRILGLLLAGLTDQTVAGQLGLSLRTLQRRIRTLMDKAGR